MDEETRRKRRHFIKFCLKSCKVGDLGKFALGADMRLESPLNEEGTMLLHITSKCGDVDLVQRILDEGVNPNVCDAKGNTAMHYAASTNRVDVITKVLLVAKGANVNAINKKGYSPLHEACVCGSCETVCALLDAGADFLQTTKHGNLPTHVAAHEGKTRCLEAVLKACSALASEVNENGLTVMHQAAQQGHLETVEYLYLLPRGKSLFLTLRDRHNHRTPLHLASHRGHVKVVRFLVEIGSWEPQETDKSGQNCYELARSRDHRECADYLRPLCQKPDVSNSLHMIEQLEDCAMELTATFGRQDQDGETDGDSHGDKPPADVVTTDQPAFAALRSNVAESLQMQLNQLSLNQGELKGRVEILESRRLRDEPREDHVTEPELNSIARELGKDWKKVLRHLEVTNVDIQSVEYDYASQGLYEQAVQGLFKWSKDGGSRKRLEEALRKSGLERLVTHLN
eukprot:m.20904 g.20904  ORF g.20904 m.20904 type:complete len:457 (+) comp28103_c0_seq2:1416-2786(+)